MNKKFRKMIAVVMAIIMCTSLIYTSVCAADYTGRVTLNKTATALDENDQTTVTLSVGGEETNLGVDIIYILGGFLSKQELEADTMINCLKDTIGEIVADGTTVNFGIVPFASTKDPVMPLTPFKTAEDMESFCDQVYEAIKTAGDVYDAVNMENALITAKEEFSDPENPLAAHPERQHLVMVSSGQTYFFNTDDANETIATVPVSFQHGDTDSEEIFYYNKAWQRARNNHTNGYPLPKHIVDYYNANTDKYDSLWDCYWDIIEGWVEADRAAGDTVVFEATTRTAGDFKTWFQSGKYSAYTGSNGKGGTFPYSSYGVVMTEAMIGTNDIADVLDFNMADNAAAGVAHGKSGPNPFTVEDSGHAIGNERAMYEAYEYLIPNIIDAGINFYPIYESLNPHYDNGDGTYATWTDQHIGHSFMNFLAGGEAVKFSADKTFFDPIKSQIMCSVSAGSYVEDFIGYDSEKGNFEFIDDASSIVMSKGSVTYTTAKLDTAKEGATSSYAFTAPGATEPTFWLDYYYGNGTTTEMFRWSFGESASIYNPAQLSYKLQLIDKATVEGSYSLDTNIKATLYPHGSDFRLFPVPNVSYTVRTPVHTPGSIAVTKVATGAATPADATFQLQKMEGNEWINVGEPVAYSAFVENAYTFTELEEGTYRVVESNAEVEGYTLETTYSANVVLTKTTADNGDTAVDSNKISVTNAYTIEEKPTEPEETEPEENEPEENEPEDNIDIPDEDVPLADVPKTGDLILPFLGMAIASGAATIFVGKTDKKKEDEE